MPAESSNNANFFSTTLTASVTDADVNFPLDSVGVLTSPAYLVIDPESDAKREVIYADGTWSGTTVAVDNISNRGLQGSASGAQAHAAGTVVTSVPLSQHVEDAHLRINQHTHDGTFGDSAVNVAIGDVTGGIEGDGVAKITVAGTAPTSPAVGDLWVDTSS